MEVTKEDDADADYRGLYKGRVIRAFLNAKWNHVHCDVCSNQNWELGRTEDFPAVAFGMVDTAGRKTETYWPVVPVLCRDCGNTKILFLPIIEDWVDSDEGKKAIAEAVEEEPE